MKIPIDADLINEVLNYLSKRPFGEVNNLINKPPILLIQYNR